jgi:hypothetical protein
LTTSALAHLRHADGRWQGQFTGVDLRYTVKPVRLTQSDKSGPHAILGEKRKRDAANIAPAFCDVHRPAGVLIDVVAQHVSDHVVAEREGRVIVEQVSEAENFPVAAIAVAN